MDEFGSYEKLSICESARSLKKYGSTSKHITRQQNFTKHLISSKDTLQGIALKYGVTTEQIRRVNRLWTLDSIFLREYLLIPIPDNSNFPVYTELACSSNSASEPTSPNNGIEDCENASDFLDKIDSSIANTKKHVKKSQGSSEFVTARNSDSGSERRKPPVSRMKQFVNNNDYTNSIATPQARVVLSQGNKLKSSLQKLEQQQDEIFEL